jgi:hypothetical protein
VRLSAFWRLVFGHLAEHLAGEGEVLKGDDVPSMEQGGDLQNLSRSDVASVGERGTAFTLSGCGEQTGHLLVCLADVAVGDEVHGAHDARHKLYVLQGQPFQAKLQQCVAVLGGAHVAHVRVEQEAVDDSGKLGGAAGQVGGVEVGVSNDGDEREVEGLRASLDLALIEHAEQGAQRGV